jgi:hypothetical protein
MTNPFWLIIGMLAAYRLTYLTSVDNGPAHVFKRIRQWTANRWGPSSWQAEFTGCFFCQSVWWSGAVIVSSLFFKFIVVKIVLLGLAISGAGVIAHWLVLSWMGRALK